MGQFNNAYQSHEHSLKFLEQLFLYQDFLSSVESVADFGSGGGLDIAWWATRESQMYDPPKPFNYKCYAVDLDFKQLVIEDQDLPRNIQRVQADFEAKTVLARPVDILWCHDTFQYCVNPLNTMKLFNQQMNENGMLCLSIPRHRLMQFNRPQHNTASLQYFEYRLPNLIYMLAVNGFDCNDAYFLCEQGQPWIEAAVYKSPVAPMDPRRTTWYDLANQGLLNTSMAESVSKYGYLRQEDMIFGWLDKNWHQAHD